MRMHRINPLGIVLGKSPICSLIQEYCVKLECRRYKLASGVSRLVQRFNVQRSKFQRLKKAKQISYDFEG